MNVDARRFPLTWPHGWPRTEERKRRAAPFRSYNQRMSPWAAIGRLEVQLTHLGGDASASAILSTNVPLRLDGRPRSEGEPADPGAALYFDLKGQPISMACDRWDRVGDNITALAMHIDALRRIDRYGVGRMEQAFGGYKAIPANVQQWWDVLEVDARCSFAEAEASYFRLAKLYHPDGGGTHEAMARLNAARDEARKAIQ